MKKFILEGFTEEGSPDSKYYAFDWDDNLMYMPTKIIVKNNKGDEVGISTEDFSHFRHLIGKENFDYGGETIVGYAENPFRYFREEGDDRFIIDSMIAKRGPVWSDFVEAINGGSIFSIITARGHNPEVLKKSVKNLILSSSDGIQKKELIRNLKKYRDIGESSDMTDEEMIDEYLDLCKFYPVTFGQGSAANPEELKVMALEEFQSYVKELSSYINKKAFLKNDVRNLFLPSIGFSDDDPKNIERIKKHFEDKPDSIIKTYSTTGGIKKKY
jgi:hypothetical protein